MAFGSHVDDTNYPCIELPCSPEHHREKMISENPMGEIVGLVNAESVKLIFTRYLIAIIDKFDTGTLPETATRSCLLSSQI